MNGLRLAVIMHISGVLVLSFIFACSETFAAENVWQSREVSPAWQTECGSCHMAFPPALLSGGDWKLLMQGLDKHFGVDASLDTESKDTIAAYLERNAASGWGHSVDSLRITETSYFMKRHKGAIRLLIKGRVKSLADCAACHKENGTENPE